MGRHHLEIPTVGEKLAHRRLRSALTVEQRRIFLGGIEIRGQDHPHQHLLAVGGLHPAFHRSRRRDFLQHILVDEAELANGLVFQPHGVNLRRLGVRRARDNELVAVGLHGVVVVVAVRNLLNDTGFHVQTIDLLGSFFHADEEDRAVVLAPRETGGILVEGCTVVLRCARLEVVNHEPVLVRLEAIGGHAPPHHLFAVGRDDGVHVVALVALRQVLGCFCA